MSDASHDPEYPHLDFLAGAGFAVPDPPSPPLAESVGLERHSPPEHSPATTEADGFDTASVQSQLGRRVTRSESPRRQHGATPAMLTDSACEGLSNASVVSFSSDTYDTLGNGFEFNRGGARLV